MTLVSSLSDSELIARLPVLADTERGGTADVIEHLFEMERRRLYLQEATSSLYRYCIERLRYSEDEAIRRNRVAKLALRFPRVLDELRAGTVHLTGLFLLSKHLTDENVEALLAEACGKSRSQIEELIARWFPRPDAPPSIEPLATEVDDPARIEHPTRPGAQLKLENKTLPNEPACAGTGGVGSWGRVEPLSASRYRVEFTASAQLYEKLERARHLVSHALGSGELGGLFERALDALLEKETKRRLGAGRPRKPRKLKEGSRHVPVEIARAVWERDGSQCTYVDAEGRRCSERRFVTIEHRQPFALGGPSTLENLCLLCASHNAESARAVFGERHIEVKIQARTPPINGTVATGQQQQTSTPESARTETGTTTPVIRFRVLSALCQLGFRRRDAAVAIEQARASDSGLGLEQLLRKSLSLLVPTPS